MQTTTPVWESSYLGKKLPPSPEFYNGAIPNASALRAAKDAAAQMHAAISSETDGDQPGRAYLEQCYSNLSNRILGFSIPQEGKSMGHDKPYTAWWPREVQPEVINTAGGAELARLRIRPLQRFLDGKQDLYNLTNGLFDEFKGPDEALRSLARRRIHALQDAIEAWERRLIAEDDERFVSEGKARVQELPPYVLVALHALFRNDGVGTDQSFYRWLGERACAAPSFTQQGLVDRLRAGAVGGSK